MYRVGFSQTSLILWVQTIVYDITLKRAKCLKDLYKTKGNGFIKPFRYEVYSGGFDSCIKTFILSYSVWKSEICR